MVNLVADSTDKQAFPLLRRVALFAEDAVVASPVVLVLASLLLRFRQAVGMETFPAKIARKKIFLVAKRPTEVAHLHKNKSRILKADF